MLASLIIVFREVFEAGLIVGIVLAATEGIKGRSAWVGAGIAAGILSAALVAVFAGALQSVAAGAGQRVFNACISIAAVLMLGWHQVSMASHGHRMAGDMTSMGRNVVLGRQSLFAMAVVVAIAVVREGAEVVLFLYGIVAVGQEGWSAPIMGSIQGLGLGALVSMLLYRGLVAIPVARLFDVTSWLIALLAAGMAGQAAATLAGADLIPAWGHELWDTSWLVSENSLPGRGLRTLIGYSDRPIGVQLVAWVTVLIAMVVGARLIQQAPKRSVARASASS